MYFSLVQIESLFFFFECGKLQPKEKGVPLRCEAFERAM